MSNLFRPAEILLPDKADLSTWAVVACDQYSSQPEYWHRVRELVADSPSALNLILPEAWLNTPMEAIHGEKVRQTMYQILNEDFFKAYPDCYIYVERTLKNGSIRRGLVGMVDLEEYEYTKGSRSAIRATEATIEERIPPRRVIRENAPLEIPHILLLCDDASDCLLGSIEAQKQDLKVLYDFNLMEEGGHIQGWLVDGSKAEAFMKLLEDYQKTIADKYPGLDEETLTFAVGDGNHSLATAKSIWQDVRRNLSEEQRSVHPARFALAELENIHDSSQQFEPIHRILTHIDRDLLFEKIACLCTDLPDQGYPVAWISGDQNGVIYLNKELGELPAAILQKFLDDYLSSYDGQIDYIHGSQELAELALQPHSIGFLLPAIEKSSLFRGVIADGSLPRKTFSMGHASEKRYYLESRKIR